MLIVCGVDATSPSEEAARRAVEYANRLGAELHVVHSVHIPPAVYASFASVPTGTGAYEVAARDEVWSRIGPILDEASTQPKRVDLRGYPAETLAAYAESVDADLVIVGSRRRGDFKSLLLGSTSHGIAHLAPCDVLIALGPEDEE